MLVTENTPAPALDLPTDGGGRFSLAGSGRAAIVFFYPKADTPGCTTEAQDFSALIGEFAALGVEVIGVSKDPVKKLDRFKAKHDLKVILASDETTGVCETWGVWGEKQLYGRKFMGIERSTFLIGADGIVLQAWRKVSVKGHGQAVLDAAKVRLGAAE